MCIDTQSRTVSTELKHKFEKVPNYAFKMYGLLKIDVGGKLCVNLCALNYSHSVCLHLYHLLFHSASLFSLTHVLFPHSIFPH